MIHTSTHSIVSSQGREPRLLTLILGKIDDYVFMRLLIDSVTSRFFFGKSKRKRVEELWLRLDKLHLLV